MTDDFGYVEDWVPGIRWDAKYATYDNFTGEPVDGYLANRVVGTRSLCAALRQAQEKAAACGFGLLLWDGYRPQRAVDCFLRWVDEPEDGRTKLRHYPNLDRGDLLTNGYVSARSAHTRGSAVDLTLYDLTNGEPAPMGGRHDLMDPISSHRAPQISAIESQNREHLQCLMEDCGFDRYDREWWHYSLREEPHPDDYFDFPLI